MPGQWLAEERHGHEALAMEDGGPVEVEESTGFTTHTLRYVTRVADAYTALWRLPDTSLRETPLTASEYAALATGAQPTNTTGTAGAVWLTAQQEWRFDAPPGRLQPGDYTEAWPGLFCLRTAGKRISVPRAAINGTVSQPQTLQDLTHAFPARTRMFEGKLYDGRG